MLKILLMATLFWGAFIDVCAQKATISNNLLYDAWLTPNLRMGLQLSPHWSTGLTVGYRPWPITSSVQT